MYVSLMHLKSFQVHRQDIFVPGDLVKFCWIWILCWVLLDCCSNVPLQYIHYHSFWRFKI